MRGNMEYLNHQIETKTNGITEEMCFIYYEPPPTSDANGKFPFGVKEEWIERVEFFIDNLTWLLKLDQKRFWEQLVDNEEAIKSIISFLQEATPYYILESFPIDDEMWKCYQKAHYCVFLIFNRLATCYESPSEFMSPEEVGDLLYNNYLITVPILLDLCLIYSQSNRAQVSTIVNAIFQMQPNYNEDLIKAVPYFAKVLRDVQHSFVGQEKVLENGELLKLNERNGQREMTLIELRDVVIHVQDTVTTLSNFLDVYTPACHCFHDQIFETSIAGFYENTIPEMYRKVEALTKAPNLRFLYEDLHHKLDLTRVEMLKIFRYIVSSIINVVLGKTTTISDTEMKEVMEDYVSVLTGSLSEKAFIRDYHTEYPVDIDLDLLSQLCPEMDVLKRDYLLEAVLACFETPPMRKPQKHVSHPSVASTSQNEVSSTAASVVLKKQIVGVELDSLITEVKDILPHLGDGFIQKCLEHFEYASDAVINAILEDALPPALKELDFSMAETQSSEQMAEELSTNIQRLNVFDNDEFDVMTRDQIDTSRIHIGKKKADHKNLQEMIDDKSHRTELRDLYTRFGLVDTEGSTYDDEYDDTYDHVDVSVGEAGEQERRPFVVPRVLQAMDKVSSSEDEGRGGGEEEGAAGGSWGGAGGSGAGGGGHDRRPDRDGFVPFAQNPEELRAKAEQRRLAMRGQRHGAPPPTRDVVGVSKGHGQEKNVTINRNNKTKRGNKSRQAGAARKRQGGMVPS